MSAPSKEQFFQELNEDTYYGYQWCRKLYGYAWSDPKFLERVYKRLDELGRDKVKYIYWLYFKTQKDYEFEQEKDAAEWLAKQNNRKYERQVTDWQKKESSQSTKNDYWRKQSERVEELRKGLLSR